MVMKLLSRLLIKLFLISPHNNTAKLPKLFMMLFNAHKTSDDTPIKIDLISRWHLQL